MRFAGLMLLVMAAAAAQEWPQFGGPSRTFTVQASIAPDWAATGPKKLWSRPLGEGYSSIVTDGDTIFTMYRRGTNEVVIAMDAKTGATRWEYAYDAAFKPDMGMENGSGPHSTPLVSGDHVYTIGILARLHALNKKTGKLVWTKDLYKDFPGSTFMGRGYSSSPMAYKNSIIVMLGGSNHAVTALNPKDGSSIWYKQTFSNSGSSPAVINVNGQDQLVCFFGNEVVGMDPTNGELLWSHPHKTNWGLNISIPVWGPDNILFISSAYNGGSKALQLSQMGGKTTVKQLWSSNRMRLHHGNAIRIGDTVYGSSGDFGPAPLTAIDVKSGNVLWQDRAFKKANLIYTGQKLLVLDEDGILALASVSPERLQVDARFELLQSNAWTAPALAGNRLFVRDRHTITAIDLL
jgi:outer membrane protein assembly factor BamB